MKNLDYLYANPPNLSKFIDRKKSIKNSKTLIIGAQNSGKSYILLNSLLEEKKGEFLYINLDDIRLDTDEIFTNLASFLQTNKDIKAIAIDGLKVAHKNYFKLLESLNLSKILLSTRSNTLNLNGFSKLVLHNLDFEEFIAFDRKGGEPGAILGSFLTQGNGLKNSFLQSYELAIFHQEMLLYSYEKAEILALIEAVKFINSTFSAFGIYKSLKEKIKISKDKIYSTFAKFEDENLIYFVDKFEPNSTLKKLYFADFSLQDSLSYKKDFHKKLANALFCELLTTNHKIYYTDELDFYIPSKNTAFLLIPFSSSDLIFLKFKKLFLRLKELKVTKLVVISMGNSASLSIEGIRCEIVPFWQFALSI
ncbi:ATP-binding protein [Campylobacter geochelonis]|uniref:ATP-binding protein n=1 Tax=Campylobacter geochelonis TaxID=1780362 RepID=UPI0007708424|nr:ATP-binding protein [Campylobacter geochelonis]CZE49698.1 putative helix-turn-helix containsing protein [Campylobacter geochelonis]